LVVAPAVVLLDWWLVIGYRWLVNGDGINWSLVISH
jgi:hypothetical protein